MRAAVADLDEAVDAMRLDEEVCHDHDRAAFVAPLILSRSSERGAERRSGRPIAALAGLIVAAAVVISLVATSGVSSAVQQAGDVPVTAANVN